MKKNKIVILIIFICLIVASRVLDFEAILSLENINTNIGIIQNFIDENYVVAIIIYMVSYAVVVALTLPLATLFTLSAGLFVGLEGTLFVVIGATVGGVMNFLITRYLIGDYIQKKYSSKLKVINDEIDSSGANYLLTLRLIPLFPFFLVNLASGVSNVKLSTFVWTTTVGIIPGSFAYVYLGSSLQSFSSDKIELSPSLITALVLVGLLTLTPVMYKKLRKVN